MVRRRTTALGLLLAAACGLPGSPLAQDAPRLSLPIGMVMPTPVPTPTAPPRPPLTLPPPMPNPMLDPLDEAGGGTSMVCGLMATLSSRVSCASSSR